MPRKGRTWHDVLKYDQNKPPGQSTLKRYYNEWRRENGLPLERCDNPDCVFHTQELHWNGKSLTLVLDHRNGCRWDNSPSNLQYLCPNCDSQLPTRSGRNRGRVKDVGEIWYSLRDFIDKRILEHFGHIPPERAGIEDRVFIEVVSPRKEEQAKE
jgi:hypothetical protein